ncbi:MAG: DUF5711 family protein [Clostridiales bacterium]|nr:DUF5711 family protein [Clostridiales bacterium]
MEEKNENKEKKKKISWRRIVLIIIAAVVIIFLCGRIYHGFFSSTGGSIIGEAINTISYEQGDKADFCAVDGGLYFVTKDGVIFLNNRGTSAKWQDTYTMMNPVVSNDGDIIGVSEKGGSQLCVYSTAGSLYKIAAEGSITSFAVNKKGGSALITETDTEYTITAYTESGFTAFMAKSPIEEGLAIGCDLSDDGSYLAVSYVYTGYTELESRIVIYNLKQAADTDASLDEEKEMVASFIRSGEILGIVSFMDNDTLAALSSSELVCINLYTEGNNVKYSEKWSLTFKNTVKAMTFMGKKYIALAYGEKNLNSSEAEENNTLAVYSLNGKELFKTVLDKDIEGLYSNKSTVIAKMGRSFRAFNSRGGRVLSYTVTQDVNKLLLYDNNSKALIAASKEAYIMNVKSKGIGTVISKLKTSEDDDSSIGTELETEAVSKGEETEQPSENSDGSAQGEESEETTEGASVSTGAEISESPDEAVSEALTEAEQPETE